MPNDFIGDLSKEDGIRTRDLVRKAGGEAECGEGDIAQEKSSQAWAAKALELRFRGGRFLDVVLGVGSAGPREIGARLRAVRAPGRRVHHYWRGLRRGAASG